MKKFQDRKNHKIKNRTYFSVTSFAKNFKKFKIRRSNVLRSSGIYVRRINLDSVKSNIRILLWLRVQGSKRVKIIYYSMKLICPYIYYFIDVDHRSRESTIVIGPALKGGHRTRSRHYGWSHNSIMGSNYLYYDDLQKHLLRKFKKVKFFDEKSHGKL